MSEQTALLEAAELITRFTEGTTEDWEWDTFASVPGETPAAEALRLEVLAIADTFPPRNANEWCAADGMQKLRAIASRVQGKGDENELIVKDSNGTRLANGDSVTLIKDLPVKGANVTLKRGTTVKNIRLTFNEQEIECNADKVKGLVLRTEFVKKA